MKRAFGRDYVEDIRDRDYLLSPWASERKSKTWRLGKLTDQGSEPSCVGHAWYGWFNASPVQQRPITASGIYKLAQYFDDWEGTNYKGTSIRGAAKVLAITGHINEYRWSFDLKSTVQYILGNGPVVAGTNWYKGMSNTDDGVMHLSGSLMGGHAYLLYGADTRREKFKVRNSWGSSWGKGGNGRISFKDFDRLICENGEVCSAVESRVM